jgi:hypothetical protein
MDILKITIDKKNEILYINSVFSLWWLRVPEPPGAQWPRVFNFLPISMKRILFFIDGFNVYHTLDDAPKYHKYKWLDYSTLARRFVSKQDQIVGILYFTAYAHWNPAKTARHQLLVRALMAAGVKVVFGKFKNRDHKCRLCKGTYSTFEEKQTDVNIAIKLFQSAIITISTPPSLFQEIAILSRPLRQ